MLQRRWLIYSPTTPRPDRRLAFARRGRSNCALGFASKVGAQPREHAMNEAELGKALRLFRHRLASLEHDVRRCFWEIPQGPGPAFFPAVMYCFATLDYFSSCWAGWNRSGPGKDQTARLIDFMTRFLLYGRKEATLAVHFWRHKLMHTSEPRVLRNKDNDELYVWRTGTRLAHYMELVRLTDQQYQLDFDPLEFLDDLRTAVLGPSGYFEDLRRSGDLQAKYEACFKEMDSYSVSLTEAGVDPADRMPAQQAASPDRPTAGG
jgi:hypothetical protein